MEAAKNVAASQVRMTGTSILTQNVTTFIKSSVNFENIFCQGWSPLRISAKLPLSSQPLARSFLFPRSMALWISLMLMGMLGAAGTALCRRRKMNR